MFNAISLIAPTSFLVSVVATCPARLVRPPPPTFSARKSLGRNARSNKLQLLESTFELRLGRARYDNQRNPVSRIATVMNSSDVAGNARKEDHRHAGSPSGMERGREYIPWCHRERWFHSAPLENFSIINSQFDLSFRDLLRRRAIVFFLTILSFISQNFTVPPEAVFLLNNDSRVFILKLSRSENTRPEIKFSHKIFS